MRNKAKDRKTLKQRLRSWLWGFLLADGVPDAIKNISTPLTVDGKAFTRSTNRFAGIGRLLNAVDPSTTDDSGEELI